MNKKFARYLSEMTLELPASLDALRAVETALGLRFPAEYVEFMLESNGAVGRIGVQNWLVIWPVEEIVEANQGYCVQEFAPGLVLFGGDGGGMLYAFDTRLPSLPIITVPDIPLKLKEVRFRGRIFVDFLNFVYHEVL